MARRGRHPQSRNNKQRRGRTDSRRPGSSRRQQPDLLADVASNLSSGEPLDLLLQISGLLAAVDPRRRNPFDAAAANAGHVTLEELAVSFAAVDEPETSALLACIGQMATDELRPRPRPARAGYPLAPAAGLARALARHHGAPGGRDD